jgi:MFS family permease
MGNSNAIITDAFPVDQRGLALGLNMVAAIAGSFLGLVIGGVLAPIDWRLVFLVSVPVSLFGTAWAFLKLHDNGVRHHGSIDWWGNLTFGVGLISIVVAIFMLPMTLGFLIAGPASGFLSDRFGARSFATGDMLIAAASFVWLLVLPVNFGYWPFAAALLVNGIGWACSPRPTGRAS